MISETLRYFQLFDQNIIKNKQKQNKTQNIK